MTTPTHLPSRGCCQAGAEAFPDPCPWHPPLERPMTKLTDTERETLREAVANSLSDELATWSGYRLLIMADNIEADAAPAVEAILTARLARIEALADEWGAVVAECKQVDPRWILDRSVTTLETALSDLRAALAAPTPTEVPS